MKPLGYATARKRRAKVLPIVAPIGGLNAREGLAAMPDRDAYLMDNWFPETDGLVTRNGHDEHFTATGSAVETLAMYAGGSGASQLLAFTGGKIFNATTPGVAGAAITTGRTNNKVITTMFSNAGNQFLIGCNGADAPFSYDGTTYTALVITGVGAGQNALCSVFAFKNRLYWCENNKLGFWYLASQAIQGAASYFELNQVCTRGGFLVAICSLTRDGGDGPDDVLCFITSKGEIVVYQGSDPSSATAFNIIGRFRTAEPIGRKCVSKYGGDVVLITTMGLIPLSKIMDGTEFNFESDAVSAKLGNALIAHNIYKDVFGWQAVAHPNHNMLIFNVPANTAGSIYYQFVMNTITMSWTRFKAWNALCWAEIDGSIYFGHADGNVYKADTGTNDNGADIQCDCKQAYNYFNIAGLKHWHNARMLIQFTGTPPISSSFNVDYADDIPVFVADASGSGEGFWDLSDWDVTSWQQDFETQTFWLHINKIGMAGSLWVRVSVNSQNLKWFSTDYIYEEGGIV